MQTALSGTVRRIMKQEAAGIIAGLLSSIKRTKVTRRETQRFKACPQQVLGGQSSLYIDRLEKVLLSAEEG